MNNIDLIKDYLISWHSLGALIVIAVTAYICYRFYRIGNAAKKLEQKIKAKTRN